MLSRRRVLKFIAIGTAGYALLPSCRESDGAISDEAKKLGLNAEEEMALASLCRAILPVPKQEGEKDELPAHVFVLRMVGDCQSPEKKKQFLIGLQQYSERVKSQTGQAVSNAKPKELTELVKALELKKEEDNDLSIFYKLTKSLTIKAYTGGRYYLTKVRPYVLVPGKYEGCAP